MKAASGDQEQLLALQGLDTRLAQLARREAKLPEAEAVLTAKTERDRVRADAATLRGSLEDAQLELRRVESDVDLIVARLAQDDQRMLQATDAKQAAAFEHEIASLQRRKSDLEDVELIVMEQVEEHQAAVQTVAADLQEREQLLADAEHAVQAALETIRADRAGVSAARVALVERLPADLIALYEKQRERYGFGASLLRRGVSEASGVTLLADEMATVRAAAPEDVLMCPSSNAILVRTGESGL